jgi:hypothetical protein
MPEFPAITHVALTFSDLGRSRPWYQQLFGSDPVIDEDTRPSTTSCGLWAAPSSVSISFRT